MDNKPCLVCDSPGDTEIIYSTARGGVPVVLLGYLCADWDCIGDGHSLVTILYTTVIGDTETPALIASHRAAIAA